MKKKLLGFLGVCALAFLVSAPTTAKADTTYTEVEDNNTAQTANEVTVTSGTNVINGVVTYETNEKEGFKKDKYDWYKITFAEQGKCNFKFVCTSNPTESEEMFANNVDFYDSDFNKCDSFIYDLAHDANETYYIRIESRFIVESYSEPCKPATYTLTLTEDTEEEYVGEQHSKMQSAYLLTRGKKAYAIGLSDYHPRWFAVKVPSGKKATITFAPVADADMNAIIEHNYHIKIVRGSDNEELGKANDVKTKFDMRKGGNIEFVGADTYYVCVDGGYYLSNNQWYSLSYDLTNAKPLDKTKPTIKGVKNGTTYKKVVTIKFSDKSGIRKATLNGKKIKSGTKVKKNGSYTLIVTDKAGNSRTVRFKIRK